MREVITGAAAGAAATVPMTWAMELLHRLLPVEESYPLPPREITDRIAQQVGVDELSNREHFWTALGAHFGYGATVGATYGALAHRLPVPPLVKGTAFGLAVWAGSYLGLLPVLDILKPATRHPPRRTALMIAAHLVWGSALGIFADLLERGSRGDNLHMLGSSPRTGGSDGNHARRTRIPDAAESAGRAID